MKLNEEQSKLILDCLRIDERDIEIILNSSEYMSKSMRKYRNERLKKVRQIIYILEGLNE